MLSLVGQGARLRQALSVLALALAFVAAFSIATDRHVIAGTSTAPISSVKAAQPTGGPALVGHVTWQGALAQPSLTQQQPITLTLKSSSIEANFAAQATDANGYFTTQLGGLPLGTYNWRVKGPRSLANRGTLTLTGVPTTSVEMGLMRSGDANDSNVVNVLDLNILKTTFARTSSDPSYDARADFTNSNVVDTFDFNALGCNYGAAGDPALRPGGNTNETPPHRDAKNPPASTNDSYLYFAPEAGGPPSGGTVNVGARFVLDLRVAAGSSAVRSQQAYLTFSSNVLQNANVTQLPTSCVPTSTVTYDTSSFETGMQNEVCNGPGLCLFRGMATNPGSIAIASGSIGACASGCGGDFQLARVGFCASTPGTAILRWQFSPPDPSSRNTAIVDSSCGGNPTQGQALFSDYVINVVAGPGSPTATANATFTPSPSATPSNTPASVATNTPLASCGPLSDYLVAPSGGVSIAPGTLDAGNHCDDCVTNVTLPFAYVLYDGTFNTANVSSNGNLQFISSQATFSNACLPQAAFNYTIFPHWDDLRTDAQPGCSVYPGGQCGVFMSVSGSAPNRVLNVEWRAVLYSSGNPANFEVRLHEGRARFDLVYGEVDGAGGSATVGVQRGTGPQITQFECNAPGSLAPGMLLVFAQTQCAPGTPTNSPTSTATNTPGPPTATPCPPLTIDGEITTNDLRMFGRLADTTPSTCAVTGTLPGLLDNLPRRYDGYKYSNTSDSAICVTVSFNANCTTQMGSAAYLGSFDPNEVTHNYLASSGGPGSATYSFQVPAAATFEVIVYGRDPSTTCSTYTLVVDGDCTLAPRHNVSGDQTLGGGSNVIRNNRCDQCDPVNTASGNFWQTIEDLSVAGRGAPGAPGIPLDFSRTYNSQATELNGPMGYGWTHSYNIYLDYEGTNTIRPTPVCTAVAVLVGHVTWQGIPQPNARSQLPLTLTIKTGTSERNYPNQTTDQDGFFTVTVSGLANGPYDWRIKGTRSLASSGVLTVTGATTLNVEMGVMRGGDANNDNVISIVDQNILKNTFGKGVGDPGYDTRADFNNDTTVNSLDFNIMKANFGTGGAPPITPLEGLKAANSKMHLVGFKPSNVPTAQAMKLWLAPGATPEPDMTNTIKVAVREGTGGSVPFTNTGDPLYHHDPEIMAELYQNPDETYVYTQTHGQLQYAFNASGFLTQISDRNHYTTTLHYNGFNELDQVTEPGGRMLVFTYTCGFLTTVADTTGRSAYFGYNSNSDLTDVIDAANNFTHYEYYTTTHRLKTITHPSGGTLTNVYDKSNRVVRQDEAVSPGITRTTQFEYITPTVSLSITPSLGITSTTIITDPLGYVTVHEYNDYQLERVTQNARGPNPPVWEYSYGQSGYPLGLSSATDPNKHTSTNTWDAKGNLLTSSDPLGHVTGYGYNATNDLAVITNSVGMTTTYGYDGNGNLTSVTRPLTQTNQLAMTTVEYDPNPARPSDVLTITNPLGNKWKYAHDPATGYVLTGTNPLTETTRYSYDGAGHVVSLTSPRGYTSTLAYNAYGDPLRITNTLGYTFTYIYDRERNLTSASDANNHAITYTYDLMSRRTRVTQPDGTHSDYGYDLNGNLITQTNALTQTMLYAYNGLNRLVGATEAVSSTNPITRSYQYDAAGNLTVITDAVGLTTTFGYDNANRLAGINYHDGTTPNVTLGYSPLGLRTMMTDGMGTTLYTYDSLDRLTQSQVQFAGGPLKTVGYGYDLADNLTSLAYPDSFGLPSLVVSRVHNKANRLTSVSDWLSNTSTFGYDADGNVTSIAYPNGAHATYAYDNADRISAITQTVTTTTFLALNYTRDGVGNLASAAEAGLGTGSYTYDALDRLAKDRLTAGSPLTRTWAYDGAYQVTDTKIEPGTGAVITTTRAYNPANELISLLERTGGVLSKQVAFTYDAKGNRKTQADGVNPPSITYSYDQANRLTSYVRGAAQTDYGYNGDGLRGKKAPVGGLPDYFAWNLAGSLPMLLQDGSASYVYGPGGSILEQVPTGASQAYFYHNDQLGSVRALTGPSGSRAATYNYDAYGVPITATGTLTNPFRYAGEYTDAESGLVYLRARHYDPSTQQFLTRDPIVAQTGQAYTYASGNPLNRVDPSGLDTGGYPNSGHSSAEGVFKYARPEPSSAVLADASHPQVVDLECK